MPSAGPARGGAARSARPRTAREARDGEAAHEQLARAPEPVGERAGERSGKRGEYVRSPRNSPEAAVLPPRSWMWYGAVGSSCSADRKTVKLNPHITKKRGVKRRSRSRRSRENHERAVQAERRTFAAHVERSTSPMAMSPSDRPIQRPTTPQPATKHSRYPTGRPRASARRGWRSSACACRRVRGGHRSPHPGGRRTAGRTRPRTAARSPAPSRRDRA